MKWDVWKGWLSAQHQWDSTRAEIQHTRDVSSPVQGNHAGLVQTIQLDGILGDE